MCIQSEKWCFLRLLKSWGEDYTQTTLFPPSFLVKARVSTNDTLYRNWYMIQPRSCFCLKLKKKKTHFSWPGTKKKHLKNILHEISIRNYVLLFKFLYVSFVNNKKMLTVIIFFYKVSILWTTRMGVIFLSGESLTDLKTWTTLVIVRGQYSHLVFLKICTKFCANFASIGHRNYGGNNERLNIFVAILSLLSDVYNLVHSRAHLTGKTRNHTGP